MTPISLPELSAGGWIDLLCAVAFGLALLVGAIRGLTGLVCALAIGFAFSVVKLVPSESLRKAAFEDSAAGRIVRPIAEKMSGFRAETENAR